MIPFHYAAENGHLSVCKFFVDNLSNKNPRCIGGTVGGYTPLHFAVIGGHFEICKLIIENVDNKNPGNPNELTPLHLAAFKGNIEIVKLILANVKDKNPQSMHGTPLMIANIRRHVEAAQLIISEKDP
jgi:ankyrin repeat protein